MAEDNKFDQVLNQYPTYSPTYLLHTTAIFDDNGRFIPHQSYPIEHLKTKFPERFKINRIVEIFQQFAAQLECKQPATFDYLHEKHRDIHYEYDHLNYLSQVFPRDSIPASGPLCGIEVKQVMIKLSNDGFLYDHPPKNATKLDGMRHQRNDWYMLPESEHTTFDLIAQFCRKILNGQCQIRILYNYVHYRIDFLAFAQKPERQVTITFEPGFPETCIFDFWQLDV
jgi:hypothetical protein